MAPKFAVRKRLRSRIHRGFSRYTLTRLMLLCGLVAFAVVLSRSGTDRVSQFAMDLPAAECLPGLDAECVASPEGSVTNIQRLARKYSPILYVQEAKRACSDSSGISAPMPVSVLLENPEVVLRQRESGSIIKLGPGASDLYMAAGDTYLDYPGNPRSPGCRYARDEKRFRADEGVVTYAHVVGEERTGELALQYWFFYYFNDWNNKHEGDWEMIQIAFDTTSVEEALAQDPVRIAYSQHSGGEVALWDNPIVRREGNHPVVYVAEGSHANHFEPDLYVGLGDGRTGIGCDDSSSPHQRLVPAVITVPHEPRGPQSSYAWLAYGGNWGAIAGTQFDGPTGPMNKWQWWAPFTWEDAHVRSSSTRVQASDSFGPDPVGTFCRLVSLGTSWIFPHISDRPLLFSGLAFAVMSVGLVSTLTRTRYFPVRSLPLRGQRRFGQILVTALDVYRRRPALFAGIGLLSLPLVLLSSEAHWRATEFLAVASPVDGLMSQSIRLFTLVVALGALHLGLIHAVVAQAATAALGRLTEGRRASFAGIASDLWRHLPALLVPRLAVAVVVAVLGFTVIGLPIAVLLAVRWAFIEQAVLLEGLSGRDAFVRSGRLVTGNWLWVSLTMAVLGLLALAVPPAAGIALMMSFKSMSLAHINLITAVIQAVLIPYVAIAFSLTYFHLGAKMAAGERQP